MSSALESTAALDRAAEIIGAALNVTVKREPVSLEEAEEPEFGSGIGVIAALSAGDVTETGFCMGSAKPHDITHRAALELLINGEDHAARMAAGDAYLLKAANAIAADPTLGGLVDWAELVAPDPNLAERFIAIAAALELTYTAPTALG